MDSFIDNLKRREIPSLYGLRGIAAMVVVFHHYCYQTPLMRWFPGAYWTELLLARVAIAVICATGLHYGVERPFLKLKARLKPASARELVGVG